MRSSRLRLLPVLFAAGALCACEVGPNYRRPSAPTPTHYKEVAGWTAAKPSDAAMRADWWTIFGDPVLNGLEERVVVSNQTLAADEAAYEASRALVAEQRAALFPTLTGTGSATLTHSGGQALKSSVGSNFGQSSGLTFPNYTLELGATWEPDLWGRIRRLTENAKATAQASYADLVNARLSAQMQLAADYITLRELDEEKRLDDATVKAYAESLRIARNKYNAGNAVVSDVDTAEATLYRERAAATALGQQRAQMEHAIAMLVGAPPADLTITPGPWTLKPVDVPPGVPSTLLQRRPDVAAAERRAAAANAQIGAAVANYFPNLTLTGSGGTEASHIADLFSPQSLLWSVGASAAQTLFNGGLTHAQVSAAKATYDEAVANYRQTSLTAFEQVEDNLAAQRVLATEQPDLQAALKSADQALAVANNQYLAGTVDYTTVVTDEATALSAHIAELQLEASRLTTTVDLVVALGGGWNAAELNHKD
ncbi:MAG: efflux transporter outer membrane subunit [Caulobacteraceae bacterium]